MRIVLSVIAVFVTIFVVPVLIYGALSSAIVIQVPGTGPVAFLTGVAVSKLGTAIAFVGLWLMVRYDHTDRIWTYVFFWWLMFVAGEFGQALGGGYGWPEALAGILSESLYLPVSGLLVTRLLRD